MKKSARIIFVEGALYVIIASGAPIVELLISDRLITQRALIAAGVMALVAGANSLKAFLSQSMSSGIVEEPERVEIVNTESNPVPTTEEPATIERMDRAFATKPK